MIADDPTPCFGKSWLFDSTDPADHMAAAELCATCPVIESCRSYSKQVRAASLSLYGYSMVGTWAGQVYGRPGVNTAGVEKRAAEEELYSDDEARACAMAWQQGEKTEYNKVGRRVYERRCRRTRDARKAAA